MSHVEPILLVFASGVWVGISVGYFLRRVSDILFDRRRSVEEEKKRRNRP